MSIFGIILLSLLIAAIPILIYWAVVYAGYESDWLGHFLIGGILSLAIIVGGTFIGIGLTTEGEQAYIAKYEAQKATIEASLQSETLGGLERAQLVNQAATLNGELAERKVIFYLWHYVTFDDTLYDGVEPIKIN